MDGDVVRVRGKERDERWLSEWWVGTCLGGWRGEQRRGGCWLQAR
jgi:hypothetical protein